MNAHPARLITGRQLEHWHTGSMTRRAEVLDALEPEAVVTLHPDDYSALQPGADGLRVQLETRRGRLTARARPDPALMRGQVFMAFCYAEAAANLLTVDALDPFGKIPEFKYCAVRVSRAGGR